MRRKDIHSSVTLQRVMDATEAEMTTLDNPGICLACVQMQMAVNQMHAGMSVRHVVAMRCMVQQNC